MVDVLLAQQSMDQDRRGKPQLKVSLDTLQGRGWSSGETAQVSLKVCTGFPSVRQLGWGAAPEKQQKFPRRRTDRVLTILL